MRAIPRLATLAFGLIAAGLLQAAPVDLNVTTLDGKNFAVSDHAGQWIVVNYWATWCGPCIKEMPELDALDRERDDVLVLGLAFEDTSADDLQRFLGKHPVTWAQFNRFCDETKRPRPSPRFPVSDAHPVHGVSFADAQAYCDWAGCSLPTEASTSSVFAPRSTR